MEIQHHQIMRDKVEDKQGEENLKQQVKEGQPPLPPPSTFSPPSPSSSPSHEFSFTISLHPPPTTTQDKAKPLPPSAVDLSPADEIFFHGHLLPLHLFSHLPVSPRSSTNSLDSFTLPITELLHDHNPTPTTTNNMEPSEIKGRPKSKSFSLFKFSKWRKGYDCEEKENEGRESKKKNLIFDISHVIKRYTRMVRPFLAFRGRRSNVKLHRSPYTFSGDLSLRGNQEGRGRIVELSAPASIRTSPTNSGLLVATGTIATSTSDSTMEELHAAIQAAIAHCKNSVAMDEKIKCQD